MEEEIKVLDQGYVKYIESWGGDDRIIEAARMSTSKGFNGWGTPEQPGDEKLLAFLYKHRHMSPFEMCGLVIETKLPIFVIREWHRHRTQSYNEMSARYIPLPDENYIPTIERMFAANNTNKQAMGTGAILTTEKAHLWLLELADVYEHAQEVYQSGLDYGVPKEVARIAVPVARYTRMRAQATLRNWLAFLTLRIDTDAQWEIRQYANAVGEIIANKFPQTWKLFALEMKIQ